MGLGAPPPKKNCVASDYNIFLPFEIYLNQCTILMHEMCFAFVVCSSSLCWFSLTLGRCTMIHSLNYVGTTAPLHSDFSEL